MFKGRLLFEKTGKAAYISHLDVCEVFRRSFSRAKLPIEYTHGYNPHAYLSIALPLPTGFESVCELLDFDLSDDCPPENFLYALNHALPEGLTAVELMARARPPKNIEYVSYESYIYGEFIPEETDKLLESGPLEVVKRTKSGEAQIDVTASVAGHRAEKVQGGIRLETLLLTGEGTVSPEYIAQAVSKYSGIPIEYTRHRRLEIYDADMHPFR